MKHVLQPGTEAIVRAMSWLKMAIHLLQHSYIPVSYKFFNVSNLTVLDLSKKQAMLPQCHLQFRLLCMVILQKKKKNTWKSLKTGEIYKH